MHQSHSHGPPCKTCKADTPHKAWGISANAAWETIAVVLHQEVHERKRPVNHGCPSLRRQLGIQVLCGMVFHGHISCPGQYSNSCYVSCCFGFKVYSSTLLDTPDIFKIFKRCIRGMRQVHQACGIPWFYLHRPWTWKGIPIALASQ